MLCIRISLLIHPKCSLYLLTPNSQSIHSLLPPLSNNKYVLQVHEFVSFLYIGSFVLYIIFHHVIWYESIYRTNEPMYRKEKNSWTWRTDLLLPKGSGMDINDIIWYLSFFDSLLLVWDSLVPTCCCKWHCFILCYGWVVFHWVYVPYLLNPFSCQWTFMWFPCLGYCKCCKEHRGACIFFNENFVQIYAQEWDCWILW